MTEIKNTVRSDIEVTFRFFESAIAYQQKNGFERWPQFERKLIEKEIEEKRHWKIMEGQNILCVFSVMYNDPVIWGEKDKDPSVYLHRIAVNPVFKGRKIMVLIREWALEYAKEKNRKFLRMDTWGKNEKLRNYYISCGFTYIGQQHLKNTEGLPAHYGGDELSLFEIEVDLKRSAGAISTIKQN
jgi:GNAT superfamily N-acetyltransferase